MVVKQWGVFILLASLITGCIGSKKSTNFTIQRSSANGEVSFICASLDPKYSKLDSTHKANSPDYLVNGDRLCVMVFFTDQTVLAPFCFNTGEYEVSDFVNPEDLKRVYSSKYDWGRYKISGDTIYTEVVKPWYNPAAHYETRYDTLLWVDNKTIKALPSKHKRVVGGTTKIIESEGYLNSLQNTFVRVDSIKLDFLNPAEAWINKD